MPLLPYRNTLDIREICSPMVRDMFELSDDAAIREDEILLDALDIQVLIDEINAQTDTPVYLNMFGMTGCTLGEFYEEVERKLEEARESLAENMEGALA